ncbi:hypothetical protein N7467_005598 [Penicillium canescens]|nr:hypothetical protein N7467_005598 [Penicillium canescens]
MSDDNIIVSNWSRLMPSIPLYTSGSSCFQDCCKVYNHALGDQPLACVQPQTEKEISQVIQFCTTKAIPFSVRSGGHDFYGRSLVVGGILIDMRAMDTIVLDPNRDSARVGGGVIAGALQETLNSYGLFTPTGQAKSVGYVSWACGGGYGFYVGTYGFGVDQILGARVVLAGGHIVDTDQEPELLWALRGAGAGTFGVVTELRVKVYTVPRLYAGFLAFPLADAATVLGRVEKLLNENFPDEFSGDAIAAHPGMTPIPVSEPSFIFFWCWTASDGDLAQAKGFLGRMVQFGTILGNTVTETTPAAYGMGDCSSTTFFRSRNVNRLQHGFGAILARHPPPQPLSAVIIHNNHGKGVRNGVADDVGAAFANRYRHIILGLHGGTKPAAVDVQDVAEVTTWVKRLEKSIDEYGITLQGGFPSFFPPDQVDVEWFFGVKGAARLRGLKTRLDPENLFHHALPRLKTC